MPDDLSDTERDRRIEYVRQALAIGVADELNRKGQAEVPAAWEMEGARAALEVLKKHFPQLGLMLELCETIARNSAAMEQIRAANVSSDAVKALAKELYAAQTRLGEAKAQSAKEHLWIDADELLSRVGVILRVAAGSRGSGSRVELRASSY